ncbi:hypothetical protein ACJX0J_011942, partial [Zea mays]
LKTANSALSFLVLHDFSRFLQRARTTLAVARLYGLICQSIRSNHSLALIVSSIKLLSTRHLCKRFLALEVSRFLEILNFVVTSSIAPIVAIPLVHMNTSSDLDEDALVTHEKYIYFFILHMFYV